MSAVWIVDGKKLRVRAAEEGWYTLNDIAHGLGVAPSTLSRVIAGKNSPGRELTASIRLALGEEAFAEICTAKELAS